MENLNPQLDNLGSQRKVSVSSPKGRKPNLSFKAPTYSFRDSRHLSTRQGGAQNLAVAGLFLIFLALTVKVLWERTIINNLLCRRYSPANNIHILSYNLFLKTSLLRKEFKGVYFIDVGILHKLILPPR